jgi:isopenicillin N synthase-like dioxygenase
MLEKMTRGVYMSTPHRVQNLSDRSRLSFPFFFDPNFDSGIEPIDLRESARLEATDPARDRWDGEDVHAFEGTFGDYILEKVGKVFPNLAGSGRDESDD